MDHADEEPATKRAKLSDGGEDLLSALPDDILINILLRLGNAAAAARTSVLSSRWRRLWAFLPGLHFPPDTDPHSIRAVLAAHEAPALHCFRVLARDAYADFVAAWIPVAARRLSGDLTFIHIASPDILRDEAGDRDAFELPCFENATSLSLQLGFLRVAVPASGIAARLTDLHLDNFRLEAPCVLGDVLSSPCSPSLQRLTIHDASGIDKFTIRSESLLELELMHLDGLQQLTVVAPALEELSVAFCFSDFPNPNQQVVSISAPQLVSLDWRDAYDPCSVQLGEMAYLRRLATGIFLVYGPDDFTPNRDCLRLVRRFKILHCLALPLLYNSDIGNNRYLMEDMTRLPDIILLCLIVMSKGHSFAASSFHILRVCTGVRKLSLKFVEAHTPCPSGCICDHQTQWKNEELVLDCLQEVEISSLSGTEREGDFVQRLFTWATMLKKMTINFHNSVTESKAKGLCQMFRSFSRSGINMEFYVHRKFVGKVMYVPED
uniref:Uncharacterized protein n=2 Tax=Avena sativa TaxID=4498 RepID=A0ACD5UZY2_AVESA